MHLTVPAGEVLELPGTIRTRDAAATLSQARSVMRALGITRLANVTGLDHVGIPTWTAVRPLARSLSVSQGKGLTHELAQVSALMECIELHHAEHFVPRGEWVSIHDSTGDPRFADALLFPIHPTRDIDVMRPVEWVRGDDLIAKVERRVPRDCVDLDTSTPREREPVFVATSNGLASGNTVAEATLHALCEIIERDQTSFWYARKQLGLDERPTRVQLASIDDAHCQWLLERCAAAGLEVVVWNATQELRLPTFVCTLFDRRSNTWYPHRSSGYGCHPYRRIALSRAITEALQSRLTHIVGGRDDVYWSTYRDRLRVDDADGYAWGDALMNEVEGVALAEIPEAPPMHALSQLLDWVLENLISNGFEQAIVVELTQAAIGIPVVWVSVPALEGAIDKPGYTPGPRMQNALATRIGI